MKLKFIGEDGYRELRHGETYICTIDTRYGSIWVTFTHETNWQVGSCYYDSLKLLNENWCDA
jgi:hypothetical protein